MMKDFLVSVMTSKGSWRSLGETRIRSVRTKIPLRRTLLTIACTWAIAFGVFINAHDTHGQEYHPYRGYWAAVGDQFCGMGRGLRNIGWGIADLGYGAIECTDYAVSSACASLYNLEPTEARYLVPTIPRGWQSPATAGYDQATSYGQASAWEKTCASANVAGQTFVAGASFGTVPLAQGIYSDLQGTTCGAAGEAFSGVALSVLPMSKCTGVKPPANSWVYPRNWGGPRYKTVDLMGGRESQIPGALNIDAQCLPGKGLRVSEGTTVQTGLPANSVGEIVCSNPQAGFISECGRILRPGGRLYVNYTKGNKFGLTEKPGFIRPKYCETIREAGLQVEGAGEPLHPKFNCLQMARTDGTPFEPGTMFYTTTLSKPNVCVPPPFIPGLLGGAGSLNRSLRTMDPLAPSRGL